MDSLLQDVRYAVRMLVKNPAFTVVAVLVLGLGIGANAATFTLTNALLLKPIEARDPHELVALYSKDLSRPDSYRAFSWPNYEDIRELNSTFASVMAHDLTIVGLTDGDATRRIFAEIVSQNYFDTFGVSPFRGRFFTSAEEAPDAGVPVAVVSYQFWRNGGSDPDLVGKALEVNGLELEIVGIAPQYFTGRSVMLASSLYVPMGLHSRLLSDQFQDDARPLTDRENHRLNLVGRLLPGMGIEEADAQLASLAARMQEAFPAINQDQSIIVRPLSRVSISTEPPNESELSMVMLVLLTMTGVVLLIACINLANMLLARGAARRREFAIRAAIGGGRVRLLRQLLTEGLLLSALGGIVGLVAAYWVNAILAASIQELLDLNSMSFDILLRAAPDIRVLAATAAFCMVGTLLFALGPAWKQTRPDVMGDLKNSSDGAGGMRHGRGWLSRRNLLVVSQVALSLVLLVAAALFMRAAFRAAQVDPGFDVDHNLLVEVDPGLAGYDEAQGRDLYRQLQERLASIPGIDAVGLAATVPFGSVSSGRTVRRAEDVPAGSEVDADPDIDSYYAVANTVGAGYFAALGVPVVRGRGFTVAETDAPGGPPVAIIDEVLAQQLWPGRDPLGRQVVLRDRTEDRRELEIVGVVGTVRDDLFPSEPQAHLYQPFGNNFQQAMNVHLRAATDSRPVQAELLQTVRREVRALDERLPFVRSRTFRDHIYESASLWIVRLGARVFGTLGALALLLAIVGIYGVKAYIVAQRTREIGIRKALGATSSDTLRLIVREGMTVTFIGLGLGLLLSAGVARLLAGMLYEVSALDPLAFLAAPAVLATAAFFATYLPARRAAAVAPIVALRQD